ncbi:MAG: restriction endonuclease subunit S [Clostridiales bacterium]|nr:hypothetical protein HMPREF0977_01775 [Clostridium sp. 1_1_41A1FAA]MDU5919413.1 restriction endonuclease subunit S [Clostridiales bacterium]
MEYRYRDASEMKDSGVEWIGQIPSDWTISRIDKEFNVRNEKVSDKVYPPLSVTKQGILPQLDNVAKSDNGDNRKKVCVGDFVINSRADRKGSCGVSIYNGSVSLIWNVLTPKRLHPQYVHSLFRNYYFSEEFYRWGSGIVDDLWSTNIEKMKKINIPIPMDKEDEKIANFLDKKTSQFDSIISKKEVLIEKLEEAKKSLISEVVTGKVKVVKTADGYDLVKRSSDEMKDSGVEWLGEIPKNWEVNKFKYVAYNTNSKVKTNSVDNYIGLENVESKTGKLLSYGSSKDIESDMSTYFDCNSVLFGKLRPYLAKCIVTETTGICSDEFLVLKSKKLLSTVLKYIMLDAYFIDLVNSSTYGAKMPRVNWDFISNMKIPVMDMEEQLLIKNFIDDRKTKIDTIINKTKLQIEKLKEAKQSLISEAVTGKIEVLN